MIRHIILWSIENRFFVIIGSLFLLALGIYAVRQTPIDAIPDLSDVQVIIKTKYPGQAPQVVEDQVTYPLTTTMLAVPGAETVRGFSFFGDSYVYIIFEEGTDLYWARSRVLEYLSQVSSQLPDGVSPELGPDATGVGWIFQYALIDRTGQHDIAALRTLQDWFLKFELQTLPGVAEVAAIGGMVRQYQVVADPNRLRAYGFPISQVRSAIVNANQETGGSVIEMAEAEYMVRSTGYIQSVEDLENIVLRADVTGTPILLKDVAEIRIGPEMRRGVGELNGEGEAVGGVVIMRWGENAQATIAAVVEKLEQLGPSLPDGVEIVTTYDRSALIARAVDNLWKKLGEEFIVVILVCAAFLLHLRSSLVILLTLPLGILAAFVVMQLQGINANIMSLGGIAIAIGAMVDAAIVMIESVHRRLEGVDRKSTDRWDLIAKSATEVGPPLFFSLVIITVSFTPVFILEAQEGRLFKPLAFTKSYAMAAAAILSITLVPVLMGYLIRGKIIRQDRNPLNVVLTWLYRPLLNGAIGMPILTVLLAVVVVASMWWPARQLGTEFMPELNEGDLLYMPSLYPGISIGKATEILQQTDRLIKTVPEVETVYGKVGRAESATDPAPLTMVETIIKLRPESEWRPGIDMDGIRAELDRMVQVPGVANVWIMPIKNRIDMLSTGVKTPVGVKVSGPDLAVIGEIAEDVERTVGDIPGTVSAYAERPVGGRFLNVEIDRVSAARFGLNVMDIQEIVRTAIGGSNVAESVEGLERFPINLRYPRHWRDSPDALRALPIVTPSGAHIPLGEVAAITIVDGPGMVRTENARPNGWVFIDIAGRDLGGYVQEARDVVAGQVQLPPGYSLAWSGQYEYIERVQDRLTVMVPATLGIIALLLYMTFRRISEVLIVLATLPAALAGGIWLIWYLGFDVSVAVIVGFIALSGVAVEIAIVMIVYLNIALARREAEAKKADRQLNRGEVREAVTEGALLRLRPIAMTVAAIMAGLLPIMSGTGTGSEIMRRVAAPMLGGMASTTLVTLLVVPAVYIIWKSHRAQKTTTIEKYANQPASLPVPAE